MIADAGQHVIVHDSYGTPSVCLCTLPNALALLDSFLENLDSETREVRELIDQDAATRTRHLVNTSLVTRALQEVVTLDIGAPSKGLRNLLHGLAPSRESGKPDERPEAVVTEQLREEVVMWAFRKQLDPRSLGPDLGHQLAALAPHEDLSIMAPVLSRAGGKPLFYVSPEALDAAHELKQLFSGKWKATATERRVVERVLEFVRTHLASRSDHRFDVAELKASY